MIQSLSVGIFLALIYSYCLHRASLNPGEAMRRWRFGGVLRIVSLGVVFIVLKEITALRLSQVLIAFISVISLYLFKRAGSAISSGTKAGSLPSQRRS